jgi:Protein of unknown function (DUF1553)/Protein of unknown function (DUF1549)/Concanavalin A-like lectin/glucanases superfamily/Planctomycete cytochrome C
MWAKLLVLLPFVSAYCAMACTAEPNFDRQVAPILAGRCLECHSGAEPKGKLDLSQAKGAMAGGESGPAIEPGKPATSLLWERITAGEMPPKHPLPEAEREVLKAWIAAGAKWGTDPIDRFRYTSATRAGYDWWSLQPIKRPPLPALRNPQFAIRNPIDAFILAKLEEKGLTPSPPAEPRSLIRRLYFDLTGLPPTPDEVARFSAASPSLLRSVSPSAGSDRATERQRDGGNTAYSALVERLLDSPHYGERWARHWLDIAHFGESDGYEYDKMRPNAWRYRDWVIDALNRDLPFDQFARLQIAGDVLDPDDPAATIATGFLVGGAFDGLMPKGETMRMIMRQDELEDLVSLVSQTFLGLTVNCARCHDHKFDPVRQADYYRLAASMAGVKRGERDVSVKPPEELVQAEKRMVEELDAIERPVREGILARRRSEAGDKGKAPQPIARWVFDDSFADSVGSLHASTSGGAKLEGGALVLDGKEAYAATPPLERDLTEKTLEAWVQLDSLDQRGGGVIGVQSLDGAVFDSIVLGEKEPRRWIAGSDFFRRTQNFAEGPEESAARNRFVHIAVVYQADGQIRAYRDGQPYGQPYQAEKVVTFEKGKSQVVFGLRHSPAGGNKMLAGKIDRARLYDRALTAGEVAASAGTIRTSISDEELAAALDEASRARRKQLAAELARLRAEIVSYRDRKAFAVTPQEAPLAHLLLRGNVMQPAEAIAPGGVSAMTSSRPSFDLAPDAADADRRRKLAAWIASPDNPLFARTIVNRLWHYHFGRGLVETPNDLGFSGGQPSHLELVDWLSAELIEHRWSLKHLHKLIITSATYQQSSRPRADCQAIDADNRLLWRYSPRRLEAEAVRDATLVIAGQFNPQMGGESVKDFRPFEYKSTQYYEPLDPVGPEFNRRSIYRMWARGGKNPLLDTFDCPDPSTATPRRGTTTTPLQALTLMNNSFTLRMADHFAGRLTKDRPGQTDAQIARAFELAYGRPPTDAEATAAVDFAMKHGLAAFCRVVLNANGFLYVD